MALFRRGIGFTAWGVGFLVSIVCHWFGWSPPAFAEAAKARKQQSFTEAQALRSGAPFREQLLADATAVPKKEIKADQAAPQPKQSLKIEDKRLKKPESQRAATKSTQPKQAFKVESVDPTTVPMKKMPSAKQPKQAMTKTDKPAQ
ncbi:hypothetical protein OR1_00347 [Geobacter sp. OR-1]|uniref:hypothetical protein n=1 Tax=Geobacter sp. OR-1 TaxID=1266765 RepID=UPI00054217A2|nr:hypothetical protein [Geobacter sp. OR-1]GAM08077.1 hypothetical protein OR1_00347 [Geobacter sp. OR-1]